VLFEAYYMGKPHRKGYELNCHLFELPHYVYFEGKFSLGLMSEK